MYLLYHGGELENPPMHGVIGALAAILLHTIVFVCCQRQASWTLRRHAMVFVCCKLYIYFSLAHSIGLRCQPIGKFLKVWGAVEVVPVTPFL